MKTKDENNALQPITTKLEQVVDMRDNWQIDREKRNNFNKKVMLWNSTVT